MNGTSAGPTYGDTIRIASVAPTAMRPGAIAAVCGLRRVESAEMAAAFGCTIGSVLYLVEYADGESAEVPQTFVELVDVRG